MRRIIAWFAANDVAANLLMIVVVAAGLITAPRIVQEVFPELTLDLITVSVPYPGAAPEEVEESINQRIEERVAGLEGIKKITSTAAEGAGAVTIEALHGTDVRNLLDDVKAQVDAIDTFPEEAEEPVVSAVTMRHLVIAIAITGDVGERALKHVGERVRDELSALPDITQVELTNARPYEISIEVSERELQRYGLTFDQVADAVRHSSLDLPGGSIKSEAGEVLLRTKGQAYHGPDFEKLVLLTRADGTRLRLGDVAKVVDGFADTDQSARFDGKPAVMVQVFRVGDQSSLKIAAAVKDYVAAAQARMPEGIRLTTWNDQTFVLRDRIDTLRRNGLQGLVLVFLTLAVFLQFRLSLWVTAGIPMAFLGTLWLMPLFDVSINALSLFSFILVLGIVVDDATVVGENVYKKHEEGLHGIEASVRGAQEVAVPVIFGVLTTVAAFIPMLMVPGTIGKIMRVFPLCVIPTLLFSLVESQLVLPAHLKHVMEHRPRRNGLISGPWKRFQGGVMRGLDRFIERRYRPSLAWALEWRYLVVCIGTAVLVLTATAVGSGWIRMRFFPNVEADNVLASLTMPRGTRAEVTAAALGRIEHAALELRDELDRRMDPGSGSSIRHILTSVGDQPSVAAQRGHALDFQGANEGAHLGEVNVQLAAADVRNFDSREVADRWRELTGPIPDAVELTFTGSLFAAGKPVQIQLGGPDIHQLREAADRLKTKLAGYPGVGDIADSFRAGKQEIKLAIEPEAQALGLTLSDLARQVRQAFYGEEAQRVQRGREDVKVMVRYPESERRSLGTIENMRIRTPDGSEVPFSTVASVALGRGYATIQRADRQRYIEVTADVDPTEGNANEIMADLKTGLLAQLVSDYPSMTYSLEGEQREQQETMGALLRGFVLALLIIYALMAVPLRSYVHPLIVMTAIPFGIVGAVWAHVLFGIDLSFMSMFGVIALVGVVVNDSLVLVDYIRRQRDSGIGLEDAVREAGAARFRPILLTSLTTFAGLTPLLLERSLQAQFLIPMAVSLGFGVLFSTAISLLLVPSAYLILEDLRTLGRRLWAVAIVPEADGGVSISRESPASRAAAPSGQGRHATPDATTSPERAPGTSRA